MDWPRVFAAFLVNGEFKEQSRAFILYQYHKRFFDKPGHDVGLLNDLLEKYNYLTCDNKH